MAKVPPDGRYQFHALFPDWDDPVGNLGPAHTCGAFFFGCAGQRVMGLDQMLSATSITIPPDYQCRERYEIIIEPVSALNTHDALWSSTGASSAVCVGVFSPADAKKKYASAHTPNVTTIALPATSVRRDRKLVSLSDKTLCSGGWSLEGLDQRPICCVPDLSVSSMRGIPATRPNNSGVPRERGMRGVEVERGAPPPTYARKPSCTPSNRTSASAFDVRLNRVDRCSDCRVS